MLRSALMATEPLLKLSSLLLESSEDDSESASRSSSVHRPRLRSLATVGAYASPLGEVLR